MMNTQEVVILIFCILIVPLAIVGSGGFTDNIQNCRHVEGEVIAKDDSTGLFILYVLFTDNGDSEGFKVYVGPDTFQNYEIGDYWQEEMCEFRDYEELKKLIQDLADMGIIENY